MHRCYLFAIFVLLFGMLSLCAEAGVYPLLDGTSLSGDPVSFNETGLIVKTSTGSFSPRTSWEKFSQEALKSLITEAPAEKEKNFIEPFIEESAQSQTQRREIVINEVPKPARPTGDVGLSAAFSSPVFVFIFFIIYLGNLYAAFEIAFYKNQAPALVCGVSAVAPFIGPIIFLSLPAKPDPMRHAIGDAPVAQEPVIEEIPIQEGADESSASVGEASLGATSAIGAAPHLHHPNLKLAAEPAAPTVPVLPAPIVFRRGEFSFNRRFFETKMPGFFRVVPGEAEKDMVLTIKAARGEFTGKRISNVTHDELHLQVFKDAATHDEMIPFNEIQEVRIRHKDAI